MIAARLDFKKEGRASHALHGPRTRSKACARAAGVLQAGSARPAVATTIPGRPRSGPSCRGSADKARYVKAALPARPLPRTVPASGAPTRSFKPPRPGPPTLRAVQALRFRSAPALLYITQPYPLRRDTTARPTGAGPGPHPPPPALRRAPPQAWHSGRKVHRHPRGLAPGHPARQGQRGRASSSRRFAGWPAARSAATPLAAPHARPELQARNSHKTGRPQGRPQSRSSIVGHPGGTCP